MNRRASRFFLITLALLWVVVALFVAFVRGEEPVSVTKDTEEYTGQLKIIREHAPARDTLIYTVVELAEYPGRDFTLPSDRNFAEYLQLLDTLAHPIAVTLTFDVEQENTLPVTAEGMCRSLHFNGVEYYAQPIPLIVMQDKWFTWGGYSMLAVLGALFLILLRRKPSVVE